MITIHELGHFLAAKYLNIKLNKIYLYPFGGVSKVDDRINLSLKKELLILIMGPIVQLLGYYILLIFLKNIKLINLLTTYNYSILIFNLLPIYPLDGGKILNNLIAHKQSYLKSINISIISSFIIIILMFIFCIKASFNLNMFLMCLFLLYKIITIFKNRYSYFNKFLLERYLYNFNFKKRNIIDNEKKFRRDYKHIIKKDSHYYSEKDYLYNKFRY